MNIENLTYWRGQKTNNKIFLSIIELQQETKENILNSQNARIDNNTLGEYIRTQYTILDTLEKILLIIETSQE